jgi:signal transduction histidine kinase
LIHWLDGLDRSRRLALRLDQVEALQAGLQQRRARFWTRVRIVGLSVLGGTLLAVAGGALALRRRHARKMDLRIEQEHRQTELEQMKIRFFTHISHELRSPLTLILGPVEKLLGELQKDEHKNLLGLAHLAKFLVG